jgi:SEC-C motif
MDFYNNHAGKCMAKQGLTTLKELLDSADNKLIPNRHELCYCGSGEKYKYCLKWSQASRQKIE